VNPWNPESFVGKIVWGWVRSTIIGAGAWFFHQGLLTQDQGAQMGSALAVVTALGLQAIDQWQHQQRQNAAVLLQAQRDAAARKSNV
jgi:hypothetical protein